MSEPASVAASQSSLLGKRKSRWASSATATASSTAAPSQPLVPQSAPEATLKRSRWSTTPRAASESTSAPHPHALRVDELTLWLNKPHLAPLEPEEARSPSPEPVYDQQGVRTNTREQRRKQKWLDERAALIPVLLTLNPAYRAPADYKKVTRFERRFYIPIKQYPDYNFIGLILGPRGATQKQMEKETGCKIVIRGKGSSKDARSRPEASDSDEIHVLVTGDSQDKVDAAGEKVQALLVPQDDAGNERKTRQLRELALLNGTLRDEVECRICGGCGHRAHVCPQRATAFAARVLCARCGQDNHLTSDCTHSATEISNLALTASRDAAMDEEYRAFMQEISGASVGNVSSKATPSSVALLEAPVMMTNTVTSHSAAAAAPSLALPLANNASEAVPATAIGATKGIFHHPSRTAPIPTLSRMPVMGGASSQVVYTDSRTVAREFRPHPLQTQPVPTHITNSDPRAPSAQPFYPPPHQQPYPQYHPVPYAPPHFLPQLDPRYSSNHSMS